MPQPRETRSSGREGTRRQEPLSGRIADYLPPAEVLAIKPTDLDLKRRDEYLRTRPGDKLAWRLQYEGLPVSQAVRLIRLSHEESTTEFERDNAIPVNAGFKLQSGKHKPLPHSIRRAVGAESVTRYGKILNMMYLSLENLEGIDINHIAKVDIGFLMKYLRIQMGFTMKDLAKRAGDIDHTHISRLENNRLFRMQKQVAISVLRGLEAPEAFIELVQQRIDGENPSISDTLKQALLEQYFFVDSEQVINSPFTGEDESLCESISTHETFGIAFQNVRNSFHLPLAAFGDESHVSRYEKGRSVPDDYTIARMMMKIGISVFDRTADVLFRLAADDRAKRDGKVISEDL